MIHACSSRSEGMRSWFNSGPTWHAVPWNHLFFMFSFFAIFDRRAHQSASAAITQVWTHDVWINVCFMNEIMIHVSMIWWCSLFSHDARFHVSPFRDNRLAFAEERWWAPKTLWTITLCLYHCLFESPNLPVLSFICIHYPWIYVILPISAASQGLYTALPLSIPT